MTIHPTLAVEVLIVERRALHPAHGRANPRELRATARPTARPAWLPANGAPRQGWGRPHSTESALRGATPQRIPWKLDRTNPKIGIDFSTDTHFPEATRDRLALLHAPQPHPPTLGPE